MTGTTTRPLLTTAAWFALALASVGCGSTESPGVATDAGTPDTQVADTKVTPDTATPPDTLAPLDAKPDAPADIALDALDTKPTGLPEGAECTPGETDPCASGLLCCVTCCGAPPPPDSGPFKTTTCVKAPDGKCPPPPP